MDFHMESQNNHISSTNYEERPLPRLPDSELTRQDPLEEFQPSRHSTTLPLCFRASTRDINTSRTERDTVRPELYHRQSTSTIAPRFPVLSVPARTSSQTSGASFNDHSNFVSNLDQINDTYMPCNSNNIRQIADRQVSRSRYFVSNDNMRSCYQNPQITARLMPRSNSPGNNPSSSRLLPPNTSTTTSPNSSGNEEMRIFATPRWQLDSEVNVCPICKSRFGFFLRKHHCRRCGRVVCDSCSPHRITIPFQYIVQPHHGEASVTQIRRIRQTEIDNSPEYIGGGRQVRLCNPCVPDPNTTPAQIVVDQNRWHGENLQNIFNQSAPTQTMESSLSMTSHSPREPSSAVSSNPSAHSIQHSGARNQLQTPRIDDLSHRAAHIRRRDLGLRQGNLSSRTRSNTVGVYSHSNQYGNSSSLPSDTLILQNSCSMSLSNHHGRSLPHPPSSTRPQISEADECWICHEELPSNSLEDFEELRTAHVSACIRHAIQLASGSRKVNDVSVTRGGNLSGQRAQNTINNSGDLASMRTNPQHNGMSTGFKLERERRTGVFPYRATEKDCIDDAECAICLEEFEIGVEMGRLECFCRFHLKCIKNWFKTRSGQCPIHQHGGGY